MVSFKSTTLELSKSIPVPTFDLLTMQYPNKVRRGIMSNDHAKKFPSKTGTPALTVRMALGSLIINEILGLSDQETVEQIKEIP